MASLDRDELVADLDHIDRCCRDFGIPRPRTFCYPGYHTSRAAVAVLAERGYAWARCGCEPTPHDPRIDHPLLVPTSAAFGPCRAHLDYSAIALRDLGRYLPAPATPADPYAARLRRHGTRFGPPHLR